VTALGLIESVKPAGVEGSLELLRVSACACGRGVQHGGHMSPVEQRLLCLCRGSRGGVERRKAGLEAHRLPKRERAERKHHKADDLQRDEVFPVEHERHKPCAAA